jgi:hypothetical protein
LVGASYLYRWTCCYFTIRRMDLLVHNAITMGCLAGFRHLEILDIEVTAFISLDIISSKKHYIK